MLPDGQTGEAGRARADGAQTGADRDQTTADAAQTGADRDQTTADAAQTAADRDQTNADRDQRAADRDQLASDTDQAASDDDHAHGVGNTTYEHSRAIRASSTEVRGESARERIETAEERDAVAAQRDVAARLRDSAADARDREADARDLQLVRSAGDSGSERATTAAQIIARAASDRRRAAADRERAAAHRAESARDRQHAADDRRQAAEDRLRAEAERDVAAIDPLTGARQRGPGLQELTREIDRAHRGGVRLVAVYIDVDGLKAANDTFGHRAGDALLTQVVAVMQAHLRAYELVTRLGGDEFLCVLSDVTIERARSRFTEIAHELGHCPEPASISVGFAQLTDGDSAAELINRADIDLLANRDRIRGADRAPSM
jgi:diguanylate cyclase (GGDEF)-like protein